MRKSPSRRPSWGTPSCGSARAARYSATINTCGSSKRQAAGRRDQLRPGDAASISDTVLQHRDLAGIHFTGSTEVFQGMCAASVKTFRTTGRIRDWLARPGARTSSSRIASADAEAVITAIIRAAFEFQGQKCSAPREFIFPIRCGPPCGTD